MEFMGSRRSPVLSTGGVCASNEPLASAIGTKILEGNGTAADACVAMAAALGVVQPCMSGLGGDSFALFFDAATKEVHCFQGNGASPAALTLDVVNAAGFGVGPNLKLLDLQSGLCVTVPGAAALWEDLTQKHGSPSLSLADLLAPAITLAEKGAPLSPITLSEWGGPLDAEGERVLRPGGCIPLPGALFQNPDLAQTLRRISQLGAREGYYTGPVAEAIVKAVKCAGGVMSLSDLAAHRTKEVAPISVTYKGLRVYETPPPSQGIAALIALRLVERVEALLEADEEARAGAGNEAKAKNGFSEEQCFRFKPNRSKRSSVTDTHRLVECMRVAHAEALRFVTDPLTQPVPVQQLLSDDYIDTRARAILAAGERSSPVHPTDVSAFTTGETSYFCCVDKAGNACSMISSNYLGFGSGIVPLGTGFPLQNRGSNFSLEPGHANQVAPNKRPYHTIIPALLTFADSGNLYGVLGAMGGFMQPMLHLQLIRNLRDCGMDPQQALDAPRWYCRHAGVGQCPSSLRLSSLQLEEGFAGAHDGGAKEMGAEMNGADADSTGDADGAFALAAALRARGHELHPSSGIVRGRDRVLFGWGHVILRNPATGVTWAGSEPRCDGCAIPALAL
ncbi:nucleophile aminohydrolase [Ochromonadaceae sp. CCMP2298]|nr:nucleophile aminohydrolase [Ochromonadaceae sp. CCMP2298]